MHRTTRGFTLIELLVVISIIGLLASVTLASLNEARTKATNSKRLQLVDQYIKALEIAHTDTDGYPNVAYNGGPGWWSNLACLGDYASDACGWNNGSSENASLNTALSPYIANPPVIDENITLIGNTPFRGATYACTERNAAGNKCNNYRLFWVMEGTSASCGRGSNAGTFFATVCAYTPPN